MLNRWTALWATIGATLMAVLDSAIQAIPDVLPDVIAGAGMGVVKTIASGEFEWGRIAAGAVVGAALGYLRQRKAERRDWPPVSIDGGER